MEYAIRNYGTQYLTGLGVKELFLCKENDLL
jgi:hypothetical protein